LRVLFVHSEEDYYSPEKPLESFERMQFGISYISAILKAAGHETRLVVPTPRTIGVVDEHIREFDPGLVCFTSVYSVYDFISKVAAGVKKRHPDLFLAVGGPHATLRPDECLDGAFDAVCIGEGEQATLELVEQLEEGREPSGIPNLYIKKGDSVERNASRPFHADLDSIPFPDRDMWSPWTANPLSRPSVLAGRGCPFDCTYCSNHALRRTAKGKYVRLRSPGNIAEEVEEYKRKFPLLVEVYLEVETLGADMKWALSLAAELEALNSRWEVPIAFGANLRVTPDKDYEELFTALARANFRFVNIGLESGSERIRREVLKRKYSNEDILSAIKTARKHGLQVGTYNLIGLPGETRKDFLETVKLNRACQPDWFLLSVFFPYPGTELHDLCVEQGLLDSRLDKVLERRRPALDLPGFSKRQVGRRYAWSPLLFYGGHRPLKEVMWLVTMGRIFSNRMLLTLWRTVRGWRSPYKQFE
jgi:anaerobic magnesium-protoporphyrin IX monomethyl ester cyclase